MYKKIPESDWKIFRELRSVALERFCQGVLDEIGKISSNKNQSSHERYLAVFKLLQRRDDELADAFNDARRSNAYFHLAHIQGHNLLDEEEFSRFSPETRALVEVILGKRTP